MLWKNQAMKQSPATLRLHFSPVRTVDISGDEQLLVTGADDKLLKLASVSHHRFMASFIGHSNWVRSARFSPDARMTASGGDDKTVRLWDTERHTLLRTWHDQASAVTHVDFEPQGNSIVACSEDSVINLFDVRSEELRQHYNRAHGSCPITQVMFHPTQDLLLSSSADRTVRIWDLRAGRLRYTLRGHERPVHACCWERTGGRFVSCDDQFVHVWALPVGAAVQTAPVPPVAPPLPPPAEAPPQPAAAAQAQAPKKHEGYHNPADLLFAPAAGKPAFEPEFLPVSPEPPVAYSDERSSRELTAPELPEVLARTVETMVTQMDMITKSLQAMEARLGSTETAVAELATLHAARKASINAAQAGKGGAVRASPKAASNQAGIMRKKPGR
jgi:hypothetical protein